MEVMQFLLFLLRVWACITKLEGKENFASVVFDSDGQLVIKAGYDSSQPMVAWGKFRDEVDSTGYELHVVYLMLGAGLAKFYQDEI